MASQQNLWIVHAAAGQRDQQGALDAPKQQAVEDRLAGRGPADDVAAQEPRNEHGQ